MRSYSLWLIVLSPGLVFAQAAPPAIPATKLTFKAAASPIPALRYELLPNFREKTQSNAAITYSRIILMLNELHGAAPSKERIGLNAKIDEMISKPTREIDVPVLANYLQSYARILRELESAAKCDHCDWGLERRLDMDGIGTLLPEVQKVRELARLLKIRCRMHIAEGKLEEAVLDIRMGLAMARHVGEQPTLIQSLVGMAVFQTFAGCLEQLIEMPNSPNMYWALTALPHPFLDMHKPLEGEVRAIDATLPILREIEKPMTTEQAQRALDGWAANVNQFIGDSNSSILKNRLLQATMVSLRHANARQALLKMGKTEAELNAMPAAQIVLLESTLQFKSTRDELFVWFHLPYPEARQGLAQTNERIRKIKAEGPGEMSLIWLLLLLPALEKFHAAAARTERKICCLRAIEALRMHAAENDGKFPAKLSDILRVPVPDDPVAGKPFAYELTKDGKARLSGPAPKGEQPHVGNSINYELTLTK